MGLHEIKGLCTAMKQLIELRNSLGADAPGGKGACFRSLAPEFETWNPYKGDRRNQLHKAVFLHAGPYTYKWLVHTHNKREKGVLRDGRENPYSYISDRLLISEINNRLLKTHRPKE